MTTVQIVTDAHAAGTAEGLNSSRKLTHLGGAVLSRILQEGQERAQLDAVLDLGDLIEHSGSVVDPSSRVITDITNFSQTLQRLRPSGVPHLHCIGNHPVMSATAEMLLNPLGLSSPYYARDIGDHRIIMLHSRFTHRVDSSEHKSGSGIFIDKEQLDWLRKELASTDRNVLVCCHHPLSDQDLNGNVWFENYPQCALMENRFEVQEVLAASERVIAVLNGHTHWNHLGLDQFGTPHITLQSLSENFNDRGTPAGTYGIALLKGASFNLEIFGEDLTLRNAVQSPDQITRDLAATYDSIAPVYDAKTSQFGEPENRQFDGLVQMLRQGHGNTVLDFGCGPGRDVPYYARQGFQVIGIDASKKLLEIAQNRSPEQHFIHATFGSATLKPGSAAIAIHNSSLQHVPRAILLEALREVYNSLESGGVFYSHYRSGEGESLSISTEYGRPIARFISLYTDHEMHAALQNVGFDIIKSETFDHKYSGIKGKSVQYKTRTWARKP